MKNVSQLSVRSGVVEDLTRTTHVSGGGKNHGATTTHIAMIKVSGRHSEFRSPSPIPLSEGEEIKIVGRDERGIYRIYALQNLATGWMTEPPKSGRAMVESGCMIMFTVMWVLVGSAVSIGFLIMAPWLAIFPIAMVGLGLWGTIYSMIKVKRLRRLSGDAHTILTYEPAAPRLP